MTSSERSRHNWFLQGFCIAFIFFAALNAASYIFRSSNIEPLFEGSAYADESIGFPFEIWNIRSDKGMYHIEYAMLALNALVGAAASVLIGGIGILFSRQFDKWAAVFEAKSKSRRSAPLQFSIGGMLATTAVISVMAGAITQWAGTRELLWFVYVAGPAVLIGVAFLPRGIRWQSRCVIVTFAALVVVLGAIWSGGLRGIEFDRVMMGIFVFWTPQSACAAVLALGAMTMWPNDSPNQSD